MIVGKNLRGIEEWTIEKHRNNWTQNPVQRKTKQIQNNRKLKR